MYMAKFNKSAFYTGKCGINIFWCLNKQIWYQEMFENLGKLLCTITGFDFFSLQPNAGASGEYVGLMIIHAYHLVW